jgi:hypothetical protein
MEVGFACCLPLALASGSLVSLGLFNMILARSRFAGSGFAQIMAPAHD